MKLTKDKIILTLYNLFNKKAKGTACDHITKNVYQSNSKFLSTDGYVLARITILEGIKGIVKHTQSSYVVDKNNQIQVNENTETLEGDLYRLDYVAYKGELSIIDSIPIVNTYYLKNFYDLTSKLLGNRFLQCTLSKGKDNMIILSTEIKGVVRIELMIMEIKP